MTLLVNKYGGVLLCWLKYEADYNYTTAVTVCRFDWMTRCYDKDVYPKPILECFPDLTPGEVEYAFSL